MKRKLCTDEPSSAKISKVTEANFGPSFRKKLKTSNAINVLQEFVSANKERDVVEQYINAGGSAKELVGLLTQFGGNKDFVVASTVFSAIQSIVVRSESDLLLIQKKVEEACDELLNNYVSTMQNMLGSSSSSTSHRKVILKLLTAMVTLSSNLAKRILTLFPINVKLLRLLTDTRSSNSAQKLRTCFVHFLLSFLIDENTAIISELLHKKGLLPSIMSGMMNDRPETVLLIMNTLRLKIVENIKISKTLKLHTFNTPVLRSIFKLYHYKRGESQMKPDGSSSDFTTQSVRQATHELLMLLCTSHRKGILFREQRNSVSGKSPNQLILTLLEDIEAPHKDELQSLLVSEILKVCPEFVRNVLTKLEAHLRPSASEDWVSLMNFVVQVIEKQELSAQIVDESHAFSVITSVAFPSIIQKLLTREFGSNTIHQHPIIRYSVIRLLLTILRKIDEVLISLSRDLGIRVREQTEALLNKTLIPCSKLVNAWKSGINANNTENTGNSTVDYSNNPNWPNVTEYYVCLADVLLLYHNLAPTCFGELRLHEGVNFADDISGVDDADLRLKRAQLTFYIYNPKPNQDQFPCMMKQFVECYIGSSGSAPQNIIEEVLKVTGFFDGFEDEIAVWLYSLKVMPIEHARVISDLFVQMLCELGKKSKKYVYQLASIRSKTVGRNDVSTVAEGSTTSLEAFESLFCLNEEAEVPVKPSVGFSPAVPALLSVLKSYERFAQMSEEDCSKILLSYSSTVFVHLLHLQSEIEPLRILLDEHETRIDSKVLEYVAFWTNKLKSKVIRYPLEFENTASLCAVRLVDGNALEDNLACIADIDEMERIMMWNLGVFYAVHLNKMRMLDSAERFHNCTQLFSALRHHLQVENFVSCLRLLLTNQNCINDFNIEAGENSNVLSPILLNIVINSERDCRTLLSNYSSLVFPYRFRFLSLVVERKEKNKYLNISRVGFSIKNLIDFIALPSKIGIRVLHLLIQLPVNLLLDKQRANTSEWVEVIRCLLLTVTSNLELPLESDDLILLISRVCELLKSNVVAVDLEETIVAYIQSFPHHLRDISDDLIQELLTCHPDSGIDKLGSYLVFHRPALIPTYQFKILQNIKEMKIESVLAALSALKSSSTIDDVKIVSTLYKRYFRNIASLCDAVASPWLDDGNFVWITRAIQQCADAKVCLKACNHVEARWAELELRENVCELLKMVFEKADKADLFVKLLISKLNRMLLAGEDVHWLCVFIENLAESMNDLSFLTHESCWSDFVKLSLKISLQNAHPVLMRTFKMVCEKAFSQEPRDGVSSVFQMTISHSAFVNTMLSVSDLKCELVSLFLILTTANVSLMSSNHMPLLLGAYKATLSKSDQLLLQVLQWYEDNGIRFNDCRPYLWGDAAVTHHSIRTEISVSLKRQPFPNQVLDLLDVNVVKNTIRYFPLDRSLRPGIQLLNLDVEVYDLSFMLPLMSHLLAPESRISIQKFTRSGALCLILIALSSEDTNVRVAAFHCLQRFHSHLSSREKEIQIWCHFTNALKCGVRSEDAQAGDGDPPRLPCLVTTFLAHMSLIISEPLHALFVALSNFLLAKPSFDVLSIPNFFMLFYSTDLKHREHQEWMLRVIRDGMRFEKDWTVAQKGFLFKLLQQFYSSALSNETNNLLILQITAKALEIQNCKLFMVTKCGLLSWINLIVRNSSKSQKHLSWIVKILKLLMNAKNASNILAISLMLTRELISMTSKSDIPEELLYVLSETYCLCKDEAILCENDIKLIIQLASSQLDSRSEKIFENCLRYKSVIGLNVDEGSVIVKHVVRILRHFVGF